MPRAGYTRTEKPALGKASDYTINQGTTKRNVAFGGFIRNLGELAVATGISVYTGSTGLGAAASIVTAAVEYSSNTKTAYLIETKRSHKDIPNLYHQYTQKWYLDSNYTQYAGSSVAYDYWN